MTCNDRQHFSHHLIATSASTATHPHGCGDLDLPPACRERCASVVEGDTNASGFRWKKLFLDWKTMENPGLRWFSVYFCWIQSSWVGQLNVLIDGKWRFQRYVLKIVVLLLDFQMVFPGKSQSWDPNTPEMVRGLGIGRASDAKKNVMFPPYIHNNIYIYI